MFKRHPHNSASFPLASGSVNACCNVGNRVRKRHPHNSASFPLASGSVNSCCNVGDLVCKQHVHNSASFLLASGSVTVKDLRAEMCRKLGTNEDVSHHLLLCVDGASDAAPQVLASEMMLADLALPHEEKELFLFDVVQMRLGDTFSSPFPNSDEEENRSRTSSPNPSSAESALGASLLERAAGQPLLSCLVTCSNKIEAKARQLQVGIWSTSLDQTQLIILVRAGGGESVRRIRPPPQRRTISRSSTGYHLSFSIAFLGAHLAQEI